MNVNLRISVEQQHSNVETLRKDWLRVLVLKGANSPQEDGIFKQYQSALKALQIRVLVANGISVTNLTTI